MTNKDAPELSKGKRLSETAKKFIHQNIQTSLLNGVTFGKEVVF